MELLPRLAGIALLREDREAQPAAQSGLAATAAAVALQAGQAGTAAVLLEQGRGIPLSRTMDTRSDVTELREQDEKLAAEFERLCRALDSGPRAPVGDPGAQAVDQRHRWAAGWEELLGRIRAVPGLKAFLRPLNVTEIRAAADGGPLVMVNVSPLRSDALLVRPGADNEVVPLPASLAAQVADHVEALTAYAPVSVRNEWLSAALAFLQEAVVERVLARPEQDPPRDGELPRLWWLPTGLATLPPFHACAVDHAVSSYTATVRALLRSREAGGPAFGRVPAVGVPVPQEELAHVAREIDTLGGDVRTLCAAR
ncbi:hypothetical protein [Streptomyces sp. NBC_00354]|uniref:hypothetical protein n=1 Tax=Streptomyces sp. NBC_00354 TaxID=2975723 RepID=UPI002E268541